MKSNTPTQKDADQTAASADGRGTDGGGGGMRHEILNEVSEHLDRLIEYCTLSNCDGLRDACTKFQVEHAASKAEYALRAEEGESPAELADRHLVEAMKRMVEFSASAARVVLRRTTELSEAGVIPGAANSTTSSVGASTAPAATTGGSGSGTGWSGGSNHSGSQKEGTSPVTPDTFGTDSNFPNSGVGLGGMFGSGGRSSSVDDMVQEGTEDWLSVGANTIYSAIQIASLLPLAHPLHTGEIQNALYHAKLLDHIAEALTVDRNVELQCFAEGFRTMHLSLLCNMSHDNREVCRACGNNGRMISALLQSTRIDEENPGMGEWAEFAIRNICMYSPEARDYIKSLRFSQSPNPGSQPQFPSASSSGSNPRATSPQSSSSAASSTEGAGQSQQQHYPTIDEIRAAAAANPNVTFNAVSM